MARTVLGDILEEFYEKLSDSEAIDGTTIAALRELFASGRKLRADDFVRVLSLSSEGKGS